MKNAVVTFKEAKTKGEKLTMLTAYDYSTAKLIDAAGINSILVGDSVGNVVLGYDDTISVTMEDMIHHSAAVSRGIKNTLLITDIGIDFIKNSQFTAVQRRNMQTGLSHHLQKSRGLQRYGFTAGIGTGNDQLVKLFAQLHIDRNSLPGRKKGMTAFADVDIVFLIKKRPCGILRERKGSFRKGEIEKSHDFLVFRNLHSVLCHQSA